MERVKMQMMLHQRTGTAMQIAGGIYHAEGVLGFWRGNGGCHLGFKKYPLAVWSSLKSVHSDATQLSTYPERCLLRESTVGLVLAEPEVAGMLQVSISSEQPPSR